MDSSSLVPIIDTIARQARQASFSLMSLSTAKKNAVLLRIAALLEAEKEYIQTENDKDLRLGKEKGLSTAMLNRLELSEAVIASMIVGLREVCALPDPVGAIRDMVKRPNGLLVGRMQVPLGVIAMIYESRPNVTIDAAALCLKAGNAVILRGGSEALHSNIALARILQRAFAEEGVDENAAQVIPITERKAVNIMLQQEQYIDLVIPRGGEGLIRFVTETSKIPVLKHYKGVCHIFVDKDADLHKATPIILNAKVQRPGVCNALEGLLLHQAVAESYLPVIADELGKNGVELRGCPRCLRILPQLTAAGDDDWGREYLDLKLVVRIVDSLDEARTYIQQYGSQHTEAIITENYSTAQEFITTIDASAVMVNASTRFNDGGQLGLGAEIGISTTKLHAYGPMGLEELTTRKFVVFGQGQVRS
ncbi:glutamate-5-semialdehyde dehydrogenase [Desulfoprunum benzoelyticum]|uniref:Gamma-glutamyl phosphate reductase n=1 Tax=Desulfoprunum benzoelyticum TaxID=1506996 RepID=A0A840UZM5_9BACT|nr:glutamate-5-semialdehyde dehydrogenase [Desulfoprunum benzoelyticum]MBB5346431.1 glutamate-5-semialdehyde dehydrogenase [Desulfoprunum benzoelyticum]MBM9528570.1 glutamate-5-semialdehyde dehydrogenase [Desulfoprunum benzoelyticum]